MGSGENMQITESSGRSGCSCRTRASGGLSASWGITQMQDSRPVPEELFPLFVRKKHLSGAPGWSVS